MNLINLLFKYKFLTYFNIRLKKGRSKKAHLLCEAVYQATQNFINKGEEIANENAEVRNEMLAAVDDVKKTGIETCNCCSFEIPNAALIMLIIIS